VALELRQLRGHAESGTTRKDRDLRDGIGVRREHGHERVPGFVDCHGMFLLGQQRIGRVTAAEKQTVPGRVEVGGAEHAAIIAYGVDRRFVHQVGEISARKSGRSSRHHVEIHVRRERLAAPVDSQDGGTLRVARQRNLHGPVEASRPQQRLVEDLGSVGRGYDDDPGAWLEPVHFREQLVECLLALMIPPTRPVS
jgi:hypothetical protein